MVTDSTLGRRTVLRSSLLGLQTLFVAGCAGTGGSGNGGESTDGTQTTSALSTATGTDVGTASNTETTAERTTQGTTATRTTGSTTTASGDTGAGSNTIVLGGEASGWTGQAPADIDGTVNPTLALQPDTTYVLTWVNLDGTKHDLVVVDANGNELRSTRPSSGTGATRSLTFRATPKIAQYYCTYHPRSMRGTIAVGSEPRTNTNGTRTTGTGTTGAGTPTVNAGTKTTTN